MKGKRGRAIWQLFVYLVYDYQVKTKQESSPSDELVVSLHLHTLKKIKAQDKRRFLRFRRIFSKKIFFIKSVTIMKEVHQKGNLNNLTYEKISIYSPVWFYLL